MTPWLVAIAPSSDFVWRLLNLRPRATLTLFVNFRVIRGSVEF
jgi:hypothetical protein